MVKRLSGHWPVWQLTLLLAVCVVQMVFGYSHSDKNGHKWGSDDAYISYRYAENLAAGRGLVFNVGERVEGYSNLLYVLLLTAAFWLGLSGQIYVVSMLLNLACTSVAYVIFIKHCRAKLGPLAWAAGLLFVLCPAVWVWTASGLETPLVLALHLGLWVLADRLAEAGPVSRRDGGLLAGLAGLSVLARVDGFILPGLVALFLAVRGRYRLAALCLAAVGAAFLTQAVARYGYYGYWLPNTYYAKVSGPLAERVRQAVNQLWGLAASDGLLTYMIVWLVAAGLALLRRAPGARNQISFELLIIPAWLAYWIYIGGDVFHERFLTILFPVGILLLLRLMRGGLEGAALPVITLVAVMAGLQLRPVLSDPRFEYTTDGYDRWVVLGEFLRDNAAGQTLAIDAAGKVPYLSQLPTIDMLGLNDTHIAHQPTNFFLVGHSKYDAEYVLGRRPDLIASWLDLDLNLPVVGLTRERYVQAGYEVAYVVAIDARQRTDPIRAVRDLPLADVLRLVAAGYQYGVLARLP